MIAKSSSYGHDVSCVHNSFFKLASSLSGQNLDMFVPFTKLFTAFHLYSIIICLLK